MKRIIFDIDDTLIKWEDYYWDTINMTFDHFNINYDQEIIIKYKKAICDYEKYYNIYNKKYMQELVEKNINFKLPNNFIDIWTKYLEDKAFSINHEIEETINYLSKKYELYALTNWFTEQQTNRLEKSNLKKYFTRIIGADKVLIKPNIESFKEASIGVNLEECIMIGDNLKTDIEGSIKAGMKAILFDKDNKYEKNENFIVIKNILELKEIL